VNILIEALNHLPIDVILVSLIMIFVGVFFWASFHLTLKDLRDSSLKFDRPPSRNVDGSLLIKRLPVARPAQAPGSHDV